MLTLHLVCPDRRPVHRCRAAEHRHLGWIHARGLRTPSEGVDRRTLGRGHGVSSFVNIFITKLRTVRVSARAPRGRSVQGKFYLLARRCVFVRCPGYLKMNCDCDGQVVNCRILVRMQTVGASTCQPETRQRSRFAIEHERRCIPRRTRGYAPELRSVPIGSVTQHAAADYTWVPGSRAESARATASETRTRECLCARPIRPQGARRPPGMPGDRLLEGQHCGSRCLDGDLSPPCRAACQAGARADPQPGPRARCRRGRGLG